MVFFIDILEKYGKMSCASFFVVFLKCFYGGVVNSFKKSIFFLVLLFSLQFSNIYVMEQLRPSFFNPVFLPLIPVVMPGQFLLPRVFPRKKIAGARGCFNITHMHERESALELVEKNGFCRWFYKINQFECTVCLRRVKECSIANHVKQRHRGDLSRPMLDQIMELRNIESKDLLRKKEQLSRANSTGALPPLPPLQSTDQAQEVSVQPIKEEGGALSAPLGFFNSGSECLYGIPQNGDLESNIDGLLVETEEVIAQESLTGSKRSRSDFEGFVVQDQSDELDFFISDDFYQNGDMEDFMEGFWADFDEGFLEGVVPASRPSHNSFEQGVAPGRGGDTALGVFSISEPPRKRRRFSEFN